MTTLSKVLARKPARVVNVPTTLYADSWPLKPSYDEEPIGFRLLAEDDLQFARAQAVSRAKALHGNAPTLEWIEAYNDAIMAQCVARAACQPDDATKTFLQCAEENVTLAFTSDGIKRLWEEVEITHTMVSPLVPQAEDEDLRTLARMLSEEFVQALDEKKQARVRRIIALLLEELIPPVETSS